MNDDDADTLLCVCVFLCLHAIQFVLYYVEYVLWCVAHTNGIRIKFGNLHYTKPTDTHSHTKIARSHDCWLAGWLFGKLNGKALTPAHKVGR